MKKILKNADAYFAGFMFAITLVVVVINVFTRKLFNFVIPWGEEVATTCRARARSCTSLPISSSSSRTAISPG